MIITYQDRSHLSVCELMLACKHAQNDNASMQIFCMSVCLTWFYMKACLHLLIRINHKLHLKSDLVSPKLLQLILRGQ